MTHIVKTRAMLGQLAMHGIEASRATHGDASNAGPDALLAAADGRCWLVMIWGGSTLQPTLLRDDKSSPLSEAARALIA